MPAASTSAQRRRVVGLIPAGGWATRLGPLPCSKEILPVGIQTEDGRPKVVSHFLLERMRRAGIEEAFFILREGKWDIPAHFKDGALVDMRLGYLIVTLPYGAPYTLDQAYPFVRDSLVALGFPDMLNLPDDGFSQLLERQAKSNADVVLGLFPADRPATMDMVALGAHGKVDRILIKPPESDLRFTWGMAVWTPAFTEFMHSYLARLPMPSANKTELHVGEVIQAGINSGLNVEGIQISDTPFLDIGIPENLARARKEHSPS
jgi:glucose-1-phosphate thymidylyltransferase